MGRKLGLCPFSWWGAASPSSTKSPWPRPTSTVSAISPPHVLKIWELRPTNGWDWFGSLGHPCKFQPVSRLVFSTASVTLCDVGTRNGITELSQKAPLIFGWAAITLGIGPHSSFPWYTSTKLKADSRLVLSEKTKFSSVTNRYVALYYNTSCVSRKVPTFKRTVTLSNLNPIKFATKPMWHYPPHLRHVATLPWEIKSSNFLQMCKKTQTDCTYLIASNFVIQPQFLIVSVFTIASLPLYWLQLKLAMSLYFYLFTFAINLWHRKFVTANVTATVFVNNQYGI